MKIKKIVIGMVAVVAAFVGQAESSAPFRLSLKSDGVRTSLGDETLTYSSQWDGGEGATVTIAQNGVAIAEGLSGEGERAWAVQRTGEYTLTHTTYTNGVAGKVETATFVVPGPELTFEYDGGPFVGGKVTINGNLDGWTIYYTLDGSTPTTESLKYTGPFTLSAAAVLKAIAVSQSGMATDLFDIDYSDVEMPYVEGIKASQRAVPENNLVDIEFSVVGNAEMTYAISFLATNSLDGAFVSMRTLWQNESNQTNEQFFLKPGKYHFVWNVKADAPLLSSVSDLTVGASCCIGGKYMSIDLRGGYEADSYPIAHSWRDSQGEWKYADKTTNLVLRLVPPGTFVAQCENSQYNNPKHQWASAMHITLTRPFYIGVFEVSQYQFAQLTQRWPSYFMSTDRAARPVESINWDVIRGAIGDFSWPNTYSVSPSSFIGRLRQKTRLDFDLPTEAQWEYACRAGTTSEYYKVGVTKDTFAKAGLARYVGNSGSYSQEIQSGGSWENATQGTAIVGSYKSNDWGLYDMLGNVNEWVLDRLRAGVDPEYAVTGSYRILRGGSWRMDEYACSCRFRMTDLTMGQSADNTGYKNAGVGNGFRIVCHEPSTLVFADSEIIGSDIPFADGDITLTEYNATYDGAAHGIGVAVKDGIEDVTIRYATGPLGAANPASEWSEEAPTLTDVGSMTVWCEISAPGYIAQTNSATLSISPRPVTVNVVGHSGGFTYDTTAKSVSGYEATTEDELYDIAADTVFGGSAAVSRIDVGTTAMGLAAGQFSNGNANFDVTYLVADGGITVTPRIIGDDPANWDIRLDRAAMYDGTLKAAPIIQVAFRKPDGNLVNIPHVLEGNTATDAGNYKVRIAGTGNYSGSVEMDWAITPRNVVLTSGTAAWTYDGAAHSETGVSVTGDGFVAGDGAAYSAFPVVTHVADAASPIANTFSYALNPGTKAGNYAITVKNGTVQMLPRAITLTAPTKEKSYDGEALTFTAAEVEVSGEGYAPGESFTLGGFASITEAGRTDATFTVADGTAKLADYTLTQVAGSLTVKKNATEITVTAKSGSWVYDGTAHTLHEYEATNLGVLLAGDELEVVFSDASTVTTPVDGELQDGVVKNAIASLRVLRNGTEDVTANYTLAPYEGTIAVVKRPVTLTSKSAEKVYDGEPLTAHEVEVGGDGFVGEDGANYVFIGTQTEKGKSANSFTYTLKSGTNAAYYEVTKVEGDLEVTAADIGESVEGDWAIVLGPALAYTGLEQIQTLSSVTFKNLQLDYSVTGNAQTDAGTYRMTLTGQGNFTGTHEVEWSIAPKALSLTAGSGSRVYDGTAFTVAAVTAEGFVAGEGAEYVCDGSQKDVGSSANNVSAINWNANTKGSNYAVTKVPGSLTVTPRPVTLTAANISKPYDGAPLALTAADITAEGLVAGESLVYSGFASRTEAGQTPATFEFAAGANTSLANYSITVTPGRTITITKSATAISVTAASESWVYDGEAHSNRTWTATNLSTLQPGDELEVSFDGACVVTTPQDGPANDGIVPNVITGVRVIRNGAEDVTANYTVEWFPGTLTVTKRPVTVTVTGNTATYTYDGTEKTVTGFDLSTEDTLYDVMGKTYFGGVSFDARRTDVGTSQMNLAESQFANSDKNFEVTYVVTDGYVKIDPADITGGEEGDFAIVLGANPKYNGTVQTIPVESVAYKGLLVTYTLAGENATHAGTYTLTVKANGNFTGEMSTTWQVLKRVVTLTSASASRVYDGTPLTAPAVTVGGDGFIGLEGATFDVTGSQTVAGSSKNAFAYTLKAGTLASDYDITKIEGDLAVAKAKYPGQEPGGAGISWNVAADAATWMYDGKTHGVALVGVPAGVTVRLAGDTAKDAGEYTASATFDYDSANYETPVFPAPLRWTIAKRPISLQTVNAEKPYDGFPLSVETANITPGLSGYAEGECFEYFDLASITEVGETPATFGYRDSATAKVSNYAVQVIGGAMLKVTVGGDQISVTAKDGVWCYDGEEHRLAEWSIVNGDKLIAGHEFLIKISDESVVVTPKDGESGDGVVSNRFEYVKIVDSATGADRTRNYNLFLYEGRLQVTNACIGVEMLDGAENVAKVYDGEATNVVVTADLLQPSTVKYALSGEGEWSEEPPEFTDAGDYTVWYEVSAEYYNTFTGTVEVAVAKRPITLGSPTKSKPYDGAALTFGSDEIAVGGDGYADGEAFVFGSFASITDAGRIAAAFEYSAAEGTKLGNYDITVEEGTLTVNASADEITLTAKSGVWAYDGSEHILHDCEVVNGDVLQPGDELYVEYDLSGKVTTPDDGEVENRIVSVRVMRGGEDGEDVTRNYSIAVYPGTLRVVNADVTFGSVDVSAFSTTAVYDGEGHTIAVVPPVLLTSPVAVAYSGSSAGPWTADPMAVAVKNAGTHTIWYRVSAKYYNDFIGKATVTISPREVTLISGSAKKVFDGTPLRKDEVTVKDGSLGFVDGEGVETVCNSSQTGVGKIENGFSYEFADGTLKDNYTIVPEFGWLEVTPGSLTVDVAGSSYAGIYDGIAHGVAPRFEGTGLNLNACEITYALVSGDESAYSPEMPKFTDVGTYTVYVKIKAQNFEVVYTEMTVAIAPRSVTVAVVGKTATYVYDKTKKTVEGYEISCADALYDFAAETVFGGVARAARTVSGTTAMGLSAGQFSNKNANFTVQYVVTDGWVKIDEAAFDPKEVFGGDGVSPLVCEKTYNGESQSVEITPNFDEPYQFLWSLTEGAGYSALAPTLKNVADGKLTVYFKFVTENYEPYCGSVVFSITPKTLTDEMVVLTDEAFFYEPGSTQKTPSVTVSDTNAVGVVISTAADYTIAYGDSTSAGAIPVVVTGKNNYTGSVTKTFDVLKRPVAPPVIGSKSYNAKNQIATITTDSRWTVVKNEGGIDVGEYEVVLRLTNSDDYMWKGTDGKSADWTGVFRITKGANGWSRAPGIANWTEGETPSVPNMGAPRRGTTAYVTYRKRGADVSTAVREQPTRAGLYTARFVVEETVNYAGTFRDVDFEILPGAGGGADHTATTPVPMPHAWLEKYVEAFGGGDFEVAGNAKGRNGISLWESYVAGLDPEKEDSRFVAKISIGADGKPVVTWEPDLSNDANPRTYKTLGKENLEDTGWVPVTDANKSKMKFFKVTVEMK